MPTAVRRKYGRKSFKRFGGRRRAKRVAKPVKRYVRRALRKYDKKHVERKVAFYHAPRHQPAIGTTPAVDLTSLNQGVNESERIGSTYRAVSLRVNLQLDWVPSAPLGSPYHDAYFRVFIIQLRTNSWNIQPTPTNFLSDLLVIDPLVNPQAALTSLYKQDTLKTGKYNILKDALIRVGNDQISTTRSWLFTKMSKNLTSYVATVDGANHLFMCYFSPVNPTSGTTLDGWIQIDASFAYTDA